MNKKYNKSLLKNIAKYEIWWLFLYLAFSLSIVIILISSVLTDKTVVIINSGFTIFSILAIVSIILYFLSILYIDEKDIWKSWYFYVSIFCLIVNLIILPVLASCLKSEYPNYKILGNMNFDASLSAILWLSFIFAMLNFIISIILTAISYKQTYPFNPPVKNSESEK